MVLHNPTVCSCRSNMRKSHLFGLGYSITQSITYFAFAIIFYYGAVLVNDGELGFENMFK